MILTMKLSENRSVRMAICVFAVLSSVQCAEPRNGAEAGRLEYALSEAGENRKELLKVIDRYSENPADSLRLRAAEFLIRNMPGHSYYKGELLENYLEYYPLLRKVKQAKLKPEVAVDSIVGKYGSFDMSQLEYLEDIGTVDSAYLCDNIEWAFKVWEEQPWGKNVSFEDFCEYILPYRVGNETLSSWREDYYGRFNRVLDSLRASESPDKEDPLKAAQCILTHLRDSVRLYFTMTAPAPLPNVGPEVAKYNSGTCREFTDFLLYICRSLGIPCARDYMPVRGDDNSGHSWAVLWDKDGNAYCRDNDRPSVLLPVAASEPYRHISKGKVYRQMYSTDVWKESLVRSLPAKELTAVASRTKTKDVTGLYSSSLADTFVIPDSLMYGGASLPAVAYLCMTSRMDWLPVDWTAIENGKIVFRRIGRGNIFRVSCRKSGGDVYLTDPFYLGEDGHIHVFRTDGDEQEMTVYAKYPEAYAPHMKNGIFEGSNCPDFSKADTLYSIPEIPYRLYTAVYLPDTGRQYRYVRYYGPKRGFCDVSEIAFYDSSGEKTDGTPIGSKGIIDNRHGHANVFDGTTLTSFSCKQRTGGWVGLELDCPRNISKIVYSPRNGDNYVRPGNEYELLYSDGTWKSAGTVTAVSDSVVFDGVPAGTLYLLRNLTEGVQERAFSYKDGRQLFDQENEKWIQVNQK